MTAYRLPDWLGGHEARIESANTGNGTVRVWVPDHASTLLTIPLHDLVEVKPASIDDPVELPLRLTTTKGGTVRLDEPLIVGTAARIEIGALVRELDVDACRDLARGLWLLAGRAGGAS